MPQFLPCPALSPARPFQRLVDRIRAGDEHALEHLLASVAVHLRQIADRYIFSSLRPYVDAEDLVQRVALILWDGLRSGKFEVVTSRQLMGLARTLLKRQAAKAAQKFKPAMDAMNATAELDLNATLVDRCVMPVSCPAKKAEANEQIQQLMKRVSKDDRRMLKLLLLNHSIADTARLLKIQPATLRMRLIRLRIRVRKVPHDGESKLQE
jgi:DNA-directed RNA polymerase specialized sigma24 family protein